ncbi:MAG: hypothetical protein ACREIT_00985 [Tepidisphaeraceae bacterium]
MDAILRQTMRLSVLSLVGATGIAALFFTYRALIELLSARLGSGCAMLGAAAFLGIGAYALSRHRDDLLF